MSSNDLAFPFAKELHEQHDALRTASRWIRAEVARLEGSEHREGFLLVPLRAFAHELGEHFRFEERHAFGVPDPEAPRPLAHRRLPAGVQAFIEEHRAFERRLASILTRLERRQGLDSVVAADVLCDLRCFFEDLSRHDAMETAFVSGLERPAAASGAGCPGAAGPPQH